MGSEGAVTIRELLAVFGLAYDDKGFRAFSRDITSSIGKVGEFFEALAGGFAAHTIVSFVREIADVADAVEKAGDSLGMNYQQLQRWQYAADLAGVGADELSGTFRKLSKNANEATNAKSEQAKAFKKLGVDVRDTNGELKSADVLMLDIADGLASLTNETEKTALSMELLGKQGPRFANLLKNGADGVRAMLAEADALGAVFDDELIESSVLFNDNISRMGYAFRGLKAVLARELLPIFDALVTNTFKAVAGFNRFIKTTNLTKSALLLLTAAAVTFGVRTTIAFAGPLLIFAKWAAIVGALWLVFDELITLWEGGDTVLGRFIDKIFGPGSAAAAVQALKDVGKEMADFYNDVAYPALERFGADAYDWFVRLQEGVEGVADSIEVTLTTAIDVVSEALTEAIADWNTGLSELQGLIRTTANFLGFDMPEPKQEPATGRTTTRKNVGTAEEQRAAAGAALRDRARRAMGHTRAGSGASTTVVQNTNITIPIDGSKHPAMVGGDVERVVRRVVREENAKGAAAHRQIGGG